MTIAARTVVIVGVIYLAIAWSLVLAVDVFDIFMTRDSLSRPLWFRIFREGGPTEWLQWSALLSASVACQLGSRTVVGPTGRFLELMAVATALMLLEDMGNVSHFVGHAVGDSALAFRLGRLAVYAALAAILLWPLVRYWPGLGGGRRWLLAGYATYAVAAGASVPANLFGLYETAGQWVTDQLLGGRLVPLDVPDEFFFEYPPGDHTGIIFLDYAVEESVELLGACFLLAGLLTIIEGRRTSTARDV